MGSITEVSFEKETPVIKEYVEEYWTKRSDGFFDLREAEIHSNKYQRWEAEIISQLPEKKCLKILDVGCGCGFFGIILARHGHMVNGIDLTPSMIAKGKILVKEENCKVDLQVMDAEHLNFADETFDVVISRNLTWTLPHPQEAYREWKRVLKKGGMLLNYDAEFAKDHHQMFQKNKADGNIGKELEQECHKIYHMLTISSLTRPEWDTAVLQQIGMKLEETDTDVGGRIYLEQDRFYIPNTIFRIKALR